MFRRTIPAVAVLSLAATGALVLPGTVQAASGVQAKGVATAFAMQASGYGTRIRGGSVPAGSDRSAFAAIGCTNRAGITHRNAEATAQPTPGLALSATQTIARTLKRGSRVTSLSTHTIDRASYDVTGGSLSLRNIVSVTRTFHDDRGFHAKTRAQLGRIVLNPAVGPSQDFPVPARGQSTSVPGVGTVTLSRGRSGANRTRAYGRIDAVVIRDSTTGARVYLAHTRTRIGGDIKQFLYSGSAHATKSNAAGGSVTSGRTPNLLMPCEGTDNNVVRRSIARVRLGTNAAATELSTRQVSGLKRGTYYAKERSDVSQSTFGNGLRIAGVTGAATVTESNGRFTRSAKGTSPGKVFFNGDRQTFPRTGALTIPGVAKLESRMVDRGTQSIRVLALRVTLLDGSGLVTDLGFAKAGLNRSGL